MATTENLMAFGLHPFLADALSNGPIAVTAGGASLASATPIPNTAGIAYVIATNSGSGLKLPQIGGPTGLLLGDPLTVFNFLGAGIQVYASGSATITGYGASASGDTGVAVGTANGITFWPVTATSWVYNRFGSA